MEREYTVQFQQAEPEPIWLTLDGVHFMIDGPLAWFYRLFESMDCEEKAVKELYPYLIARRKKRIEYLARLKNEKAAAAPQQTAAQPQEWGMQLPTEIIP